MGRTPTIKAPKTVKRERKKETVPPIPHPNSFWQGHTEKQITIAKPKQKTKMPRWKTHAKGRRKEKRKERTTTRK